MMYFFSEEEGGVLLEEYLQIAVQNIIWEYMKNKRIFTCL